MTNEKRMSEMRDPNEGKVVMFTNITDQDFSHPWGGHPYFVKAGETVPLPFYLGDHLATHLARKILLATDKGARAYDPKDLTNANGLGTPIWNQETENQMKAKILGDTFTQEAMRPKSEHELLREQVEQLKKLFEERQLSNVAPPTSLDGYKDKGEVIAELKKLGQPVDARKSKDKLEEQLAEAKKNVTQ